MYMPDNLPDWSYPSPEYFPDKDANGLYMPDNLPDLRSYPSPEYCPDENANSLDDAQQFNKGLETFGQRLFSQLEKNNREKNIIFSPLSIETCIAMARMGANGKTASEIDAALGLSESNSIKLANNFHALLAQYENSPLLTIANKMFVMRGYEVNETFDNLLRNKFYSSIDPVNFADNGKAAKSINTWVKRKTNNLISNLITKDSLSSDTSLVLINAIHFEAEWENQFLEGLNKMDRFYLDDMNTVFVEMMKDALELRYGEFPEYDAKALEMPYKNSNFSFLIFLPNSRTGLAELTKNLGNKTLSDLTERMSTQSVDVRLPKFKAEFEIELSDTFANLGMPSMFSSSADFSGMLKSSEGLKVSKVIHKASIEISEKGTKAAAASGISVTAYSLSTPKHFEANKPFLYFLKDGKNIIFSGNVKKFKYIK